MEHEMGVAPIIEKVEEESIPTFNDEKVDHTEEWARLLEGENSEFPINTSNANHYFKWPHIINGEKREQFDHTKSNSFRFIPPQAYLEAYNEAKRKGEI